MALSWQIITLLDLLLLDVDRWGLLEAIKLKH